MLGTYDIYKCHTSSVFCYYEYKKIFDTHFLLKQFH